MKVLISDLADKANIKFGTSGLRGLVTDLTENTPCSYENQKQINLVRGS